MLFFHYVLIVNVVVVLLLLKMLFCFRCWKCRQCRHRRRCCCFGDVVWDVGVLVGGRRQEWKDGMGREGVHGSWIYCVRLLDEGESLSSILALSHTCIKQPHVPPVNVGQISHLYKISIYHNYRFHTFQETLN